LILNKFFDIFIGLIAPWILLQIEIRLVVILFTVPEPVFVNV
jgi:hypothetical protein